MRYRPEIDGLRAVAVLPVIAFHAGSGLLAGGFVGVDVFFVVSGYLITGILIEELRAGRFSLAGFYERRARRILPALFLVVAACIPFAWAWLLPGDMAQFASSVAAVALFVSNFLFWSEAGYFDTAAELKPLLHTWSLAVEEQFYVLFPLLLLGLWRLAHGRVLPWLVAGVLGALVLSHWSVLSHPEAAFFLIHARAWELLAGAALACWLAGRASPAGAAPAVVEGLALLGLGLIAWAVFAYDASTPFPGLYAIAPVAGTALVVAFAQQGTLAARLLGSRLLVGVGLISYSAYLWHQPLFAFARHRSLSEPGAATFLALTLLTLVLAALSWRFVERPFRERGRISRRSVVVLALAGSLLFVAFGLVGRATEGSFGRSHTLAEAQRLEAKIATNYGLRRGCSAREELPSDCMTASGPDIAVWGDSYAMHLMQGLQASWDGSGIVQLTSSECAPIPGQAPVTRGESPRRAEECIEHNDGVLRYIERTPSLRYVVLSARFERHIGDEAILLRDGRIVPGRDVALDGLVDVLRQLRAHGLVPLVVSAPPRNGVDVGRCLVAAALAGQDPAACDVALADDLRLNVSTHDFLARIEAEVTVLRLHEGMCAGAVCPAQVNGVFLYRDAGHLSREGSAWLGRHMDFGARIRNAR